MLGLAFHPQYAKNKRFYVQYTDNGGDTRVVEYRSNGTAAIPASARLLFRSGDPYGNHNGGMLAFAPNGRLYFTMGDGGAGGDPENRSQNRRSLFGKLLSINVATRGLKVEALGLRNAWRFSFDRANGDLYIGDVGQGATRGDLVPARRQRRARELRLGRLRGPSEVRGQAARRPGSSCSPIAQYSHDDGCSVTGGYVYRGSRAALRAATSTATTARGTSGASRSSTAGRPGSAGSASRSTSVTSFGEDAAGRALRASRTAARSTA